VEVRLRSKFEVGERHFIGKPHSAKIEILILQFSLEGSLKVFAFLFAGKVEHAVPLVFEFPIEGLSGTSFAHPLIAVANKSGFWCGCG
jgi:hypothetical protein